MEDINKKVLEAKNNEVVFAEMINENHSFIMSCAYQTIGRYVSESDDAYSIALIAFNEAVNSFDESKGNFFSFAKMIINRRLIDYIRKEEQHSDEINVSMNTLNDDTGELKIKKIVRSKSAQMAMDEERRNNENRDIKAEIEDLNNILKDYSISFYALTSCSPKAEKTKVACAQVILTILHNDNLYKYMKDKKSLPIGEIQKNCDVPRKIIERHRKYIIAATEIMKNDFVQLQEYMHFIRKVEWFNESSNS